MRSSKNKIMATAVSLFLMFAIAFSLVALPAATAQATMKTYAYIGAIPNPIGVGQEVLLHVGITQQLNLYYMCWEGLTVTVTKPDGTTETIRDIKTDSTGGTGVVYVPTMVGNYTLQTNFPEQKTTNDKRVPGVAVGTVMLASSSDKLTLVVTEEPIPIWPGVPLPTEYWTRPINAQLHEWHTISGDWVGYPRYDGPFVPYNDGPETAHILWAKQLVTGGLAGGLSGLDNRAHSYECGDAYEGKFASSVILGGVLYYNQYESRMPTQEVVAVDLHTGEELWCRPLIDPGSEESQRLSFGQAFYWDAWNYHGVFGYLWTTVGSTWHAYNPVSGDWVYSMTNVPSGTSIYGPSGEIYRYDVNEARGWTTLWNSSRTVQPQTSGGSGDGSWRPHGNTYNATTGIEWNITTPAGLPGSARVCVLGDRVVGTDVSTTAVRTWAFSIKPEQKGLLLFNKTWNAPADWAAGNLSISFRRISVEDGVFTIWIKETREHWGFSTETGEFLWKTEPEPYLNIYGSSRDTIAYGKLFTVGYSGILHAYDVKTGKLLWTYEAYDPYNEILWSNDWPLYMGFVTDGKIYVHSTEHSVVDPKPRGALFYCIDVETGEEVFTTNIRGHHWGESPIIGDSIIAMYNSYDQRIYAMGKGPSTTTVTAPLTAVQVGQSFTITGTITDKSPGTKEYALTARFPNGVPVVADENMSDWMQYVYMQFARPADATGVEVVISVIDPNNNYYEVGTATSDLNGVFGFTWAPEVPGLYQITATFEGSKSYYGSYATTYLTAVEAPQPTPAPTPMPAPMTDMYVLGSGIAMIIAIVVGFALLLLRKR